MGPQVSSLGFLLTLKPFALYPICPPPRVSEPFVNAARVKPLVIVDDETPYLEMLEQLLPEALGCPVRTFSHPLDALARLRELDVGFVVSDYDMPQLNGLDFLQRVHEILPAVPCVMVTGHHVQLKREHYARLPGLRVVLRKPVEWRDLAAVVRKYWSEPALPPPPTSAFYCGA